MSDTSGNNVPQKRAVNSPPPERAAPGFIPESVLNGRLLSAIDQVWEIARTAKLHSSTPRLSEETRDWSLILIIYMFLGHLSHRAKATATCESLAQSNATLTAKESIARARAKQVIMPSTANITPATPAPPTPSPTLQSNTPASSSRPGWWR